MRNNVRIHALIEVFKDLFGDLPQVYRAPGRVNLIGEHTDYSGGLAMPVAINLSTWVAIKINTKGVVRARSTVMRDFCEFQIGSREEQAGWARYIQAVVFALEDAGYAIPGADLVIDSELPIGSGLASSAALEVALALAMTRESHHDVERVSLAQICQRAENEFVGVKCGVMDQIASACGIHGHSVELDCTDLTVKPLPVPRGVRIVVGDTTVSHAHGTNEYNRRREELEMGLTAINPNGKPGWIRYLNIDEIERAGLPENSFKRLRHVVTENERVRQFGHALKRKEVALLKELMALSHKSLRDDYEVSCPELDAMVYASAKAPGVLGTRMTGGGFGGCTVSLVEESKVEDFVTCVTRKYRCDSGLEPKFYDCSATEGAKAIKWRD